MNNYLNEEKEIVWLPKSIANQIKDLNDKKMEEEIILKYIDESRSDIKNSLESLDDDLLQYRALMVKTRNAFKEAKEEQLQANYELWENFDKEMPSLQEKIDKVKKAIEPVSNQIKELNEALGDIRSYELKDLLEVIKGISQYLGYDNNAGKILKFLVKNYK
jgi:chromosome segregation ATPase